MTRFRALLVSGVIALTLGFGGCFPNGDDVVCDSAAPEGATGVTICEME